MGWEVSMVQMEYASWFRARKKGKKKPWDVLFLSDVCIEATATTITNPYALCQGIFSVSGL
jgi:hypothetical protein